MPNPVVVTGARGPSEERGPIVAPQRGTELSAIPEGKRVFQFVAGKYRLQLTSTFEEKLPDGRIRREKPLTVVADEYIAVLDKVKDAKAIELLEQHDYYGRDRDFWDLADVMQEAKEKRESEALRVLTDDAVLKDPVKRKAIIEALRASGGDDFELPKVKGGDTLKPKESGGAQ